MSNQKVVDTGIDQSPADTDFVSAQLADPQNPVILFSLSWCSFCRAAKQLLQQLGVAYRVFELDTGELDPHEVREIRQQLLARTGSGTLPQLFVGGESVGGYTETHHAWRQGRLGALLETQGITITNP